MNRLFEKSFSFILFITIAGCTGDGKETPSAIKDNALIHELYLKDIEIRQLDAKSDTVNLEAYDQKHREQIFHLLAENKVITARDKIRAALILQHTAARLCDGELSSLSAENFLLAYKLSSAALSQLEKEKDTSTIRKENVRRMIALNVDRYLLFTFGYQKFGTQFVFDDTSGEMLLAPIDTTLSDDAERRKYNVEPLNTLRRRYTMKPMPVR